MELKEYTAAFFYSPFCETKKEDPYLRTITATSEDSALKMARATVAMNDDFLIAHVLPEGHAMELKKKSQHDTDVTERFCSRIPAAVEPLSVGFWRGLA